MLTAMDRSSPIGAAEAGALAGQGTQVAGSTLRAPERTVVRRPGPTVDHPFAQPEKWLIGVPFRPTASRVVWMYYVVDEAGDVSQAVHAALERANCAEERHMRGGGPMTADDLEVRRITLDALGQTGLDGPGDRPDGSGDPAAVPLWWET
ncbi:hypothetical protein CP966_02485 [Streptomyces galilaeus]|uniref:hypothetical protein n=1 Tax=Streptomyces galilaeus TaxID=33899 RepID=UPI00123CAF8D|nr:hypothetical protein [Streptomyces galilaeus]QEU64258.1 hypothetical protein CP966_02485 [Streptomyces galilaeus]GGW79113.1 hypothetical protein GCM10010350_74990 [Streptomyces galilaeus]